MGSRGGGVRELRMRNKKTAALIQAALERSRARQNGPEIPNQTPVQKLDKVRCIVERRMNGERNWRIEEIAHRENLSYMTVYRTLKRREFRVCSG